MRTLIFILIPAISLAQEFPFQQEIDSIPVQVGSWQPFCPWTEGLSWSHPAFGDLDADGDPDLLVGNFQPTLLLFLNQGDSSQADFMWVNSDTLALDSLDYKLSPEMVDMEGDGDPDLLLSDNSGVVRYFQNQSMVGQISFILAGDSLNGATWANRIAAVDVDGDGDQDLFSGSEYGRLLFFQNDGSPAQYNYVFVTDFFANIDVGSYAFPTFCDLDSDGDYDLFIGNSYGKIWYYRNDGDPTNYDFTFVSSNWLGIDVGDYASPEFCDIDGDGDYDLFVGREPTYTQQHMGDVFFYENNGTPQNYNFRQVTSNYLTLDLGSFVTEELVDIDADGDLDLFAGVSDEIRFYRNLGDASNPQFTLEEEYFQNISHESLAPCFGDLDSDGDYDLLVGEGVIPGPPNIYHYQNQGTPQAPNFILIGTIAPAAYEVWAQPALADIDADGDLDLFVGDCEGNLFYMRNVGTPQNPNFQYITANWMGINQWFMYKPQFFDIDFDGDLDLFFCNDANIAEELNLCFYENVGSPQNPNMVLFTESYIPFQVWYPIPWFCDVDADNKTDLFIGDAYGGILFFHGMDTSTVPPRALSPYRGPVLTLGPNPANPSTWISFTLTTPQEATLAVYNILGAKVTTLTSGPQKPGEHTYYWNASQNASGVYIIRLETPSYTSAQRIVVVK